MIELSGVGLRRGGKALFDGFSLMLSDPGVYSIEGPTGSGKTLLGRLLAGQLKPQQGRAAIDGVSLYSWLGLGLPPIWYCEAAADARSPETVENYLRTLVYDSGGNVQQLEQLWARAEPWAGLTLDEPLDALSAGQLAVVQLLASALMPLRLIVLDGHCTLLDPTTRLQAVSLLLTSCTNRDTFLLLLSTGLGDVPADLQGVLQLQPGLPVRLWAAADSVADDPGDTSSPSAVYRVMLIGGRVPGLAYQSGQHYAVRGLLERGLRIEVTTSLAAAVAEMEGGGLRIQGIEREERRDN